MKVLPLVPIILLLAGCPLLKPDNPSAITAKIAIQYATTRYIAEDPARADRVETAVRKIRAAAMSDTTASIDDLGRIIRAHIPPTLPLEDLIAINALIDLILSELQERVDDRTLSEETILVIDELSAWILDITKYYHVE